MPPRPDPNNRFCILITSRCDSHCPDCIYKDILGDRELGKELITEKIVPELTNYHDITLAGGEPTLHTNFWEIMSAIASAKPARLQIVTNGFSFSDSDSKSKKFFSMAEALARQTGARIDVRVSVGDPYANRRSGSPEDLRQRVQRIARAADAHPGANLSFSAALLPGQTTEEVIRRYGLPKEKTGFTRWEQGIKNFGTAPGVIVDAHGRVFKREFDMVRGKNSLGSLHSQGLGEMLGKRRHR